MMNETSKMSFQKIRTFNLTKRMAMATAMAMQPSTLQRDVEYYEEKYRGLCIDEQDLVAKFDGIKAVTEKNRELLAYLGREAERLTGSVEKSGEDQDAVTVVRSHIARMSLQFEDHLSMEMQAVLARQAPCPKAPPHETHDFPAVAIASFLFSFSILVFTVKDLF
jgi:hypothetical protein